MQLLYFPGDASFPFPTTPPSLLLSLRPSLLFFVNPPPLSTSYLISFFSFTLILLLLWTLSPFHDHSLMFTVSILPLSSTSSFQYLIFSLSIFYFTLFYLFLLLLKFSRFHYPSIFTVFFLSFLSSSLLFMLPS